MSDIYTKAVLTVIAAALVTLAAQQAMRVATAEERQCGSADVPCAVILGYFDSGRSPDDRYQFCGHPKRPCFVTSRQ